MTPRYKINCFREYVLRTPLFPISFYLKLVENYTVEKAINFYNNPLVKEAIGLASPELQNQLNKWADKTFSLSDEKKKALELTFLKYLARMSSRCTPFGLFAGCSVGKIDIVTNIVIESFEKHKRHTQFDMQFWIAMLQNITKREEVVKYLKYYPNTSIYEVGDFYRYVEYKYVKAKREHTISALRKSDLLKEILMHAKTGITIDEMISFLAEDNSEKEEALAFIFQLIDFQFLISELDAVVTGSDEWNRILSILGKNLNLKEYLFLKNIINQISDLDTNLIPEKKNYENIKKDIQEEGFEYDQKYLFQTDLNIATIVNSLDKNIAGKVKKAIWFLNGVQPKNQFKNLENFKRAFIHRYESREMPLMTVLDTEIGVGYLQNQDMNDTHELLEGLSFKTKNDKREIQSWNSHDFILQKKLQECIAKNDKA